ncbi:phage tail tape measure protein [Phytopseudomonas daroniae]|uniref:phage tail tape measure protein n=1 Tax=Phytopseudomonas daroniae TaxID=2487519 RepID=UPI0010383BB9|nr:phage tail tape measure protein [Pseudomonas daroniae]TBU78174.1 phage tail tape measure protein [Pseudomonas daroniae]
MAANKLQLTVLLSALDRVTAPLKKIQGGSIGAARALKETRDRLKELNSQQKDISAWRTQRAAAKQTEDALQANRERLKSLSAQLAATSNPTRALTRDFQRAAREGTFLKNKLGEQQQQLHGLRGQLNAAGISTRNLSSGEQALRSKITATNAALQQQEARLKRITAQQQRLAGAKQAYGRTQQLSASMAGSGAGSLAMGYGLGRPLMATLGNGVEFDTTMARVQALTRLDKGSAELDMLRKQARDLGATTLFTSSQVAEGQAFLGMAGFDPQKIKAAMPGILDMAKAGNMDLGETADIGSNILTGMNLQADQMARVADVITAAFTRSNTSISTLGETMKYAAPGAAQFGISLETTAAMAAKLGDAGIQGSMGGTSIRRILGRLAAPNKAAREALKKLGADDEELAELGAASKAVKSLGINVTDAAGNMRDVPSILKEIYDRSRNMGDIERGSLWKAIAGETGSNAMGILVDQAGTGNLQELIATLQASQGEAAKVASTMADNFSGDWDQLKSAWADLGIELFEGQNSMLRELAQNITGVIRSIGGWIRENPKLAGQIVKTLGGIAALVTVMGGLTLAMASILGPIAMVRYAFTLFGIKSLGMLTAFKALGSGLLWLGKAVLPIVGQALLWLGRLAMANPIGLLITVLAGGAYLIYKNWDAVKGYFGNLWAEITTAFSGGIGGVAALLLNWSPIGLFYKAFASVLSYFGIELPGKFSEFGGMLIDGLVGGITAGLGKIKAAITGAGGAAIGWFKEKLGIHSPSRVFAQLGGFTMAGLGQGLAAGEGSVLKQVASTAKQLTAAGAATLGIGFGTPAMADMQPLQFDRRPPLTASTGGSTVIQGDTYHIKIEATPGTDTAELERMFKRLLAEHERNKAQRLRSSLRDQE